MFTSNLYGQTVYAEHNSAPLLRDAEKFGRGYVPRDRSTHPTGFYASVPPLPPDFLIPRSEWRDRCELLEKSGQLPSQVLRRRKFKGKNQQQTNYCWVNGPVGAGEATRVYKGLTQISYSPASVGAPIKGYRNVGGWGAEAVEKLMRDGAVPSALWPDNAIDPRYDTAETRKAREDGKIRLAYDLPERSFDALFSALLRCLFCAVGYNWWSHEVFACDPLVLGANSYGIRIRNSWGERWEDEGFGVLEEGKATPDDAQVFLSGF